MGKKSHGLKKEKAIGFLDGDIATSMLRRRRELKKKCLSQLLIILFLKILMMHTVGD